MISKTVNLTIRMNRDTKNGVELLAKRLGTSISDVMNILATGFVRNQGFPTEYISLKDEPTELLEEALEEAESISVAIKTMIYKGKKYTDKEQLIADINEDNEREFREWEKTELLKEKNLSLRRSEEFSDA